MSRTILSNAVRTYYAMFTDFISDIKYATFDGYPRIYNKNHLVDSNIILSTYFSD